MKILQVCPISFSTSGGGFAEYVRNISVRLARRHDVTVYGSNPGGRFPRFEIIDRVKVERFKHFSPNNAYYLSLELPLRLRKAMFDVVHGHGYQAFPMHFSPLARCRKLVISLHFHRQSNSPFRDLLLKLFKPFGERTLRAADRIVAVSEYEASLICEQFKLNPNKIVVVPCGVDLFEFKSLKSRKRDFRSVLYVGRLENYKGAQFLVEALPRLDDYIVLEIVGKGPMKPALERRAKELHVLDRVRFSQDLPRHELLQKFVDADVFVLLSRYEAYSMAVAEALVAGTPCIVADASASKEWIDDRTCFGLGFPISSSKLAKLIGYVLEYGIRKEAVSKEWIGSKILDWNDVVERLEDVYRQ